MTKDITLFLSFAPIYKKLIPKKLRLFLFKHFEKSSLRKIEDIYDLDVSFFTPFFERIQTLWKETKAFDFNGINKPAVLFQEKNRPRLHTNR
jgi:hypothetical protein